MQKISKKYCITACVCMFAAVIAILVIGVVSSPKERGESIVSENSSAAEFSSSDTAVSSAQNESSAVSSTVTSSDTNSSKNSSTTSSENQVSSNYTVSSAKPSTSAATTVIKKSQAQTIAEKLISVYYKYSFLGVCCEADYINEDMSEFLNFSQLENYYGVQYKLSCCHSVNEVKAHILKFLEKSLITHNTEENLFFDDKNNLYVMVMPFGISGYDSVELVEYSSNKIIAVANICDEYGELVARNTFTITKESGNYIIKKIKRENYLF